VQVSYPSPKSAVTVQLNNLGIPRGNLVLTGSITATFKFPVLALQSSELPNNITGNLTLDGQPISARWFDNYRNDPNSEPKGRFNFGQSNNVELTGSATAFLVLNRDLFNVSNEKIGASRFFIEPDGTRVAEFTNTQFNAIVFDNQFSPPTRIVNNVGLLNGTLRSPTTTGQLSSSLGTIDLKGTQGSYSVKNSVAFLALMSRRPLATAEFSNLRVDFDTVTRRATSIVLVTANGQGYSCAKPSFAGDPTPVCTGVSLGSDNLTYSLNNTTLRNQTTGQSVQFSGTLTAVTGE